MPRANTHPATSERGYSEEQTAWILAVEAYQKRTGRKFLFASDFLAVALELGYRKVGQTEEGKESQT
jgi:hypothetical protein